MTTETENKTQESGQVERLVRRTKCEHEWRYTDCKCERACCHSPERSCRRCGLTQIETCMAEPDETGELKGGMEWVDVLSG